MPQQDRARASTAPPWRRAIEDDPFREIAAAMRLLEIRTDADLERFLSVLMRRATGGRAGSRADVSLRALLTRAAGRVLPVAAPRGAGGASGAASPASLGLELEGLSSEDREFETARAFVRFVEAATRGLAAAPSTSPAVETAVAATTAAARRHLPGLVAVPPARLDAPRSRSAVRTTPQSRMHDREGDGGRRPRDLRRTAMDRYETQEWESEWEAAEPEFEGEFEGEYEDEYEWERPDGQTQAEEEMELVNELLEVTSEQELDQFLGKLFRKAAKAVGGAIKSPVGKALGQALKGVAKTALPIAGGAIGSFVAPGLGTALGAQLGSMASQTFEMDLERMDEQEAEYEVASRFVKLARSAAKQAARAPRSAPPKAVAKAALTTAAKQHARGLLRHPQAGTAGAGGGRRGARGSRNHQRARRGGHVDAGWTGHAPDTTRDGGRPADDGGEDTAAMDGPRSGRWVEQDDGTIVLLGV